ncbi:leishmanolysin-related zinc metalloendopeptidase [Roseovarius aestuariivivens]|uniref:leishmanolysin-related zinc metalloendopeptidase n=1 Tax=Roseovarius aestuariivivens TaxID=1888910 RepID=UPI0010812A27|nr:leishmanolysin-related zinc metalloendopeptidase [Roseovarius aestuariivivens]
MKRQNHQMLDSAFADVLPPEFDEDLVSSFFNFGSASSEGAILPANAKSKLDLTKKLAQLGIDTEASGADLIPDAPQDADVPPLPEEFANAIGGLENAEEKTPLDLWQYARPLDAPESLVENPLTGGGAKPSWAGGNKDETTDGSGGSTKKGKGHNKDTTSEEPNTDGTTTDGTTSGGDPTPEVNPGSADPDVYVSGMDNPEGYNVEIIYIGTWSDSLRQGIQNVAERISDIITADLPEHNGIDDISITATLENIDGTGGYWGWGGYSSLRSDSLLPSSGYMRFDTSDTARIESLGLWEDLMMHEMLHAMGFGTVWASMGLIDDYNGDLRFTGTNAIEAYNREFFAIADNDPLSDLGVMVETEGGPGTAGVHWDDATFTNELMTGNLRTNNYLSDMSIAALEDMGYSTVYGDGVTIA